MLDASAALGILQRRGVGKIRRLDVGALWLQEKEFQRRISLHKIKGEKNPADLGTKHLSEEAICRHIEAMSMAYVEGRATSANRLIESLEMVRRIRLPERWSPFAKQNGWKMKSGDTWSKAYKGARALRPRDEGAPSWSEVSHYTARDRSTGMILLSLDVRDVREDHPALRKKLVRPCDLEVELKVHSDAYCLPSNTTSDKELSEGGVFSQPPRNSSSRCQSEQQQ